MESAQKLIVFNQFQSALTVLEKEESSDQVFLLRGLCQLRLYRPAEALQQFEHIKSDLPPSDQAQNYLLQAIAQLQNGQAKKSLELLDKAQSLASVIENAQEFSAQLENYRRKAKLEAGNQTQKISDAAYLGSQKAAPAPVAKPEAQVQPAKPVDPSKPKVDLNHDWYQNANFAFISYKTQSPEIAQGVKVDFTEDSFTLSLEGEELKKIELANASVPGESSVQVIGKKVELKVAKKEKNMNWMALEKGAKANLMASQAAAPVQNAGPPTYPSSSNKRNFNYDNLDKQLKKELEGEKPEGEAAMNQLFQQIYAGADEDTKRAMIKSYQTSGGTVLSTNWGEVSDKDYAGKDRPTAPDGQEWADEVEARKKKEKEAKKALAASKN